MKEKSLILKSTNGLHARPAAELVRLAGQFKSDVTITNSHTKNKVNAKSILQLLTLSATYMSELHIQCSGGDEEQALDAISEFLNNIRK